MVLRDDDIQDVIGSTILQYNMNYIILKKKKK